MSIFYGDKMDREEDPLIRCFCGETFNKSEEQAHLKFHTKYPERLIRPAREEPDEHPLSCLRVALGCWVKTSKNFSS
jgi:hypothetical protein